jgi:hypothetical protein
MGSRRPNRLDGVSPYHFRYREGAGLPHISFKNSCTNPPPQGYGGQAVQHPNPRVFASRR